MLRELPEGWEGVRLEDITSKIKTINPENYPNKEFFYLDIDSIDNSRQKITNPKKILGSEAPSRARQIVKSGDILFSTVRTYLKNIAFVEEQYDNQIASTGFCVIRPKKEVYGKFIFNFVQTQDFLKKLELLQRGANYPAVRESDILSQQIPLPPLQTQRQIVTVLEQTEAVRRQRQSADALTEALLQSVFNEMFGDPVRNERCWDLTKIEEICDEITVGIVVRPASYYVENGVPTFRSLNIRPDKLNLENFVYISSSDNDLILAKSKIRSGDVLVVRTGYPGTACVVPPEFDGANCIDLIILRPKKQLVDCNYLSRFLNSEYGKAQSLASNTGLAQQHLNIGAIRQVKIPLPPLALQQQFALVVEHVERIRERQVASGKEIEGLCEGLMQRAFAGELGM